uniref:Protein kinase domain-containing protein n=1 Tax=Gouania willdenowi TaxID=441366 RepID=A0A8C5H1M6_GOUWI
MLLLLRTFSFGPSTRYTILEFIGEGTFGKVAKCRAHNSSKLVAVKILKNPGNAIKPAAPIWPLQQEVLLS